MTETAKTAIYVVVAALVALVAYAARPSYQSLQPKEEVGAELFPEFTDPAAAASMEITKFAEGSLKPETFEVRRDSNTKLWMIPTRHGYPADAEDQMKEAMTALVELKVLGVVSEVPKDHKELGVREPTEETQLGDEGIGTLVTVAADGGKPLAELIVGKQIPRFENRYFVRRRGEDVTFDCELNPSRFSTNYEDWIEQELLEISSFDIKRVRLRDYSVNGRTGEIRRKHDMTLNYEDNKWALEKMTAYDANDRASESTLAEFEEIDDSKLNDLKTAVDELKLVDVARKPVGLGKDLRVDRAMLTDEDVLLDLQQRGFYVMRGTNELLSAKGEVHVWDDENIEYILRFGNAVTSTKEDEDGSDNIALNRYMFVTARVDESRYPAPELEAVPELPAAEAKRRTSGR